MNILYKHKNEFFNISIVDIEMSSNCKIIIDRIEEWVENKEIGDELTDDDLAHFDKSFICEIDLWGKYFFPKFSDDLQLYHKSELYNNGDSENNLESIFKCLDYAMEFGLKHCNIKPY